MGLQIPPALANITSVHRTSDGVQTTFERLHTPPPYYCNSNAFLTMLTEQEGIVALSKSCHSQIVSGSGSSGQDIGQGHRRFTFYHPLTHSPTH